MDDDRGQNEWDAGAERRSSALKPQLRPGDELGNFRVSSCLCAGLIADYYHMHHIRDMHEVTVAVLHPRAGKDERLLGRLSLLQKKIKVLDQPGVPKIDDIARIEGRFCLFMAPVRGRSLSHWFAEVSDGGAHGVGPEATTRMLAQLLGLLGYVHSQGLDHRDLDSDMIYMQEDGSLILLGVGLKAALGVHLFEEVVSASVSPLSSTDSPLRVNSFDIMSPEYQGGVDEDSRVDLYGAGVLGYWLLTAKKPSLAHYEQPSSLVPDLVEQWDRVIEKLLERNRDKRFQSGRPALLALKATKSEPESEKGDYIQRQIDRIPVPKGVVARGTFATRIYRLSVIGVLGISLVALAAQLMLSVLLNDGSKEAALNPITRVADGASPQLRVTVSPPAARVDFIGLDQSFLVDQGQLDLAAPPGRYRIRVSAPDHISQKKTVMIAEEAEFLRRITVRLEEDILERRIRTEPAATILLVGEDGATSLLGQSDAAGGFQLRTVSPKGDYAILARKSGYATARLEGAEVAAQEAAEEAGPPLLEMPLAALPATARVTTVPAGATIRLGDTVAGESPLTLEGLEVNQPIRFTASLEGYRKATKTIEFAPGADSNLAFGELVPLSAELLPTVEFPGVPPEEAAALRDAVVIDFGEFAYPLESADLEFVPEGDYAVRAAHPLYRSEPVQLSLRDGQRREVRFRMEPRPGQVRLKLPEGLTPSVRAGGRAVALRDGVVALPAWETLELQVRIPDYLTMVRTIRLEPTETLEWSIKPVPIPAPEQGEDWTVPYVGIRLAWIASGSFEMGSPPPEQGRLPNEGERTEVTFSRGYWAATTELTQAQFGQFMDEMPAAFTGSDFPVEQVTWEQAVEYCQRLTEAERRAGRLPEGYRYRLPTEAEWEYAARGGTTTPFHFGDQADPRRGNFRGAYPSDFDSAFRARDDYGTVAVGQFAPNAFGLYDVHGNVREWTADGFRSRLPGGARTDPAPREGGERYAVRGGSWEDFAVRVRSAAREGAGASTRSNSLGFRVFLAPDYQGAASR